MLESEARNSECSTTAQRMAPYGVLCHQTLMHDAIGLLSYGFGAS